MEVYLLASLLAAMMVPVPSQRPISCFVSDPAREAVVMECKDMVMRARPTNMEAEAESLWRCFMNKMGVLVMGDMLIFPKLIEIIDRYVIMEKRGQFKEAVRKCMPYYFAAYSNKVHAFFQCYGPIFVMMCPLGL